MEKKLTKEEQKQKVIETIKRSKERVATDPEYKKEWEKKKASLEKIALMDDVIKK